MPSITDDHSLFATSSAPCTMAFACAQVAHPSLQMYGRCMGFTSFLKVPIRMADPMKGLGTFYPPHVLGNPLQCMTSNGLRGAFWPQLLHLHEETSVSCLVLTTVQSNVHIRFPYPLPWRASTVLFSRLGCFYKLLVRVRSFPHAARLTIAPHLPITRDARIVRVTSFRRWFRCLETRHFEWCRF